MAKKRHNADPHAAREARKYARPIASREYLLELLETNDGPMSYEEICAALGLESPEAIEALARRLRAMERDGQLLCNRRGKYGLLDRMDLVRGRVIAHRDGYGFLTPEDAGTQDDWFIPPREMRALLHGDEVVARTRSVDRRGRREVAVVEVIARNTSSVVGRYTRESGVGFVQPENKHIHQDVLIPRGEHGGAKHGQIVVADITEQPTKHSHPIGRVTEIMGDHMAPGMEIDVAIRTNGLPDTWSEEVSVEAHAFGTEVSVESLAGRADLRDECFVTIDGADARDFDDAVYCEPNANGWRLKVAIADVSHYVRPGTTLDAEASLRGTSVYFPDYVIPMLPEALSNGLCSLNPDVVRLCMVCDMRISREGMVTRSRFYEGVIRSHARLTYDEVFALMSARESKLGKARAHILPNLGALAGAYEALRGARELRGAIDLDSNEVRIVFGTEKKIERLELTVRNDAHRLIEECMIAANVCAARYLTRHKMPTLFRVHEGPKPDKLNDLQTMLDELGIKLGGGMSPGPKEYADLVRRIAGRPEAHLLQTVLLRSLSQAVYRPQNVGHFGLALESYAHFTSPIRRYPDLLVHRAIRHVLGKRSGAFPYDVADMQRLGAHCSMTERRADDATRDAVDWLKCEYMLNKVGEIYDGTVASVTSFGLFVELDDIYVEGLVHVSAMGSDYFHFDPVRHRLDGERTGVSYRLADRVRVQVARVNLDERKIDFEFVDKVGGGGQKRKLRSDKHRRRGGQSSRRYR